MYITWKIAIQAYTVNSPYFVYLMVSATVLKHPDRTDNIYQHFLIDVAKIAFMDNIEFIFILYI